MIIDNRNLILKDKLKEWIDKSDEILVCSPFITSNDVLFDLMEGDKKVTLICRLSFPATPELFTRLLSFTNENKSIYVYDDDSLHSKVYLFKRNGDSLAAIIGSSNFTNSGIYSNKEYNLLVVKELDKISEYFNYLIEESYSKLNKKVIEYYKTFYKAIDYNERYKKAKISKKLSLEYSETLDKFYLVKGLLEKENNTELPFTYLFDSFCHYFKVHIVNDYDIREFDEFNIVKLKKYFKIFINDYFKKEDLEWRKARYVKSKNIRNNLPSISSKEIKEFFLGIHSISNGSGSGVRIRNIESIDKRILIELLGFLLKSSLNMSQKYSIALTKKDKDGLKIDYIGESAIGEIPGWLMPEKYPIKNSKLHYIFDFFKI